MLSNFLKRLYEKFMYIFSEFPINRVFLPNVQKYAKIKHLSNFLKKIFEKFLENSVFRPNAQKLSAGFLKFLEKYAKIILFSNFLKTFFVIF